MVTIITRTCNRESLKQVIEDVKNQTYKDIEHLIIEGYDRFKAADEGFKKAKGDIILLLDDDDRILPSHVEDAVKAFTDDVFYVNTGFEVDRSGIGLTPMRKAGGEFVKGGSVYFMHSSCFFFRASLLNEFSYLNPEYNCPCEDAAFAIDIAMKYKGVFTAKYSSIYMIHGKNTSGLIKGDNYDRSADKNCKNTLLKIAQRRV
jgi:Glycosyltransferases, probably involved in cell wall biogenesis